MSYRLTPQARRVVRDVDWDHLTKNVTSAGNPNASSQLVCHLHELGAQGFLHEEKYIDRDCSADYLQKDQPLQG